MQKLLTQAMAAQLAPFCGGLRVYAAPVAQGLVRPCVLIEGTAQQKKQYPCGRYWEEYSFVVRYLPVRAGAQAMAGLGSEFVRALEVVKLRDGSLLRALDCRWEIAEEELRLSARYGAFFLVDSEWPVMQELRLQNEPAV